MIKAIIFDCFGVLVQESLKPFYKKYLNDDPVKIARSEEKMAASNRGEITYEEWLGILGELAGIGSAEEVGQALEANPRNEELLQYIRHKLKPHYKIGFLSNASANWLDELFLPEDMELFDSVVLSYETGFAKPEAQIFEIAADKLEVRLDECVFTDDREDYLLGAQGVGMHAILYKDFEQFKVELESIIS